MPTKIDCGLNTCKFNDKSNGRFGTCQREGIVLKYRMAGDFGKGNIVFIECMEMELPEYAGD